MSVTLKRLHSKLQDVPLAKMRVSEAAQRDIKPSRVDFLASEFDPEMFGHPVVSFRDGHYYIIDGQHRVGGAKKWLGDAWESQSVTCRVYTGLSEQDEADMFDRLNNQLTVGAFPKFKVRVTAGRKTESEVKRIVEKAGLKIAVDGSDDSVSAVTTLVKVYKRSDAAVLQRALRIARQSFGGPGLTAPVIDGLARVCARYNGELRDDEAIERLHSMRGGVGQLMTRAGLLRQQTGRSVPECVAAATIDTLNGKRGGRKLPSWWQESAQ